MPENQILLIISCYLKSKDWQNQPLQNKAGSLGKWYGIPCRYISDEKSDSQNKTNVCDVWSDNITKNQTGCFALKADMINNSGAEVAMDTMVNPTTTGGTPNL